MPSLETARRIASIKNNGAKTIGQIYKENSDFVMEEAFWNDIQAKVCYIYDYEHDDAKDKKDHMTYESTTKTRIDAKFIVTQYGSISKDQVAFHLMFRPSQKMEFSEEDELYYFETNYRKKYDMAFPTGLFVDIPNEKGIYEKWLILTIEQGNQFTKFNVLPCNYLFEWIEVNGSERYKRRMWGVDRQQLSYTSGVWRDYNFESLDNVDKAFLPLNEITKNIKYVGDDNNNQRMFISAKVDNALVWKVTKLENTKPIGIIQLTFSQTTFDPHNDYIEKDENGNIVGMWANYFDTNEEPLDTEKREDMTLCVNCAKISSSTSTVKIGGSYKTLSVNIFNDKNEDITDSYSDATFEWNCSIGGNDYTYDVENIKWMDGNLFNQKKIKFLNNKDYLKRTIEVKCSIIKYNQTIESIISFELVI